MAHTSTTTPDPDEYSPWEGWQVHNPFKASLQIPSSKSVSARAIILAALSGTTNHPSRVFRVLKSRDTDLMVAGLQKIGANFKLLRQDETSTDWEIWWEYGDLYQTCSPHTHPHHKPADTFNAEKTVSDTSGYSSYHLGTSDLNRQANKVTSINCGIAGTVARFIPALSLISQKNVEFYGDTRASARPLKPLLDSLRKIGANICPDAQRLPFKVENQNPPTDTRKTSSTHQAPNLHSDSATNNSHQDIDNIPPNQNTWQVDCSESSQFLSALILLAAAVVTRKNHIHHLDHNTQIVPHQTCTKSTSSHATPTTPPLIPDSCHNARKTLNEQPNHSRDSENTTIRVFATGNIPSWPHVKMTLTMMRQYGIEITPLENTENFPAQAICGWEIGSRLKPRDYWVETDLSNAGLFLAAAAITSSELSINFWGSNTKQVGEKWPEILHKLGIETKTETKIERKNQHCTLTLKPPALTCSTNPPPYPKFHCVNLDMSAAGELVPTLSAIIVFTDGVNEIHGISHLRGHECDRLAAIVSELQSLGIACEEIADGIRIVGIHSPSSPTKVLHPTRVFRSHKDHRMAGLGALLALVTPGIKVDDIQCTSKTMSNFLQIWEKMIFASDGSHCSSANFPSLNSDPNSCQPSSPPQALLLANTPKTSSSPAASSPPASSSPAASSPPASSSPATSSSPAASSTPPEISSPPETSSSLEASSPGASSSPDPSSSLEALSSTNPLPLNHHQPNPTPRFSHQKPVSPGETK